MADRINFPELTKTTPNIEMIFYLLTSPITKHIFSLRYINEMMPFLVNATPLGLNLTEGSYLNNHPKIEEPGVKDKQENTDILASIDICLIHQQFGLYLILSSDAAARIIKNALRKNESTLRSQG